LIKKQDNWWKIAILISSTAFTLAVHYGWVLQPLFGHSNLIHAIHGRLCYIPIVIAASWFGLRGGLCTALAISILVLPFIFFGGGGHTDTSGEFLEIIFYFAIASLTGGLVDREAKIRRKQDQTQLQLEKTHKLSMIGQMAAGIAHEIKNPLASIKGAFEIVCHKNTEAEEKKEFEGIVFKEVKRIDDTVSEFLEFARPKEFKLKKIKLADSLKTALKQMQNQINSAGVELKTNINNQIFVFADPQKIHQVIINLVLNAIEASKVNDIIEVSLSADDSNACIKFSDKGEGLSSNEIDKIFEPFYTSKAKGTGLGLTIIKSIIERHDGSIKVNSVKGKGTDFIITLPLYKGN